MPREYHPGDLGTAVYRALAGGKSPNTEPSSFADALGWFVKAAGGNVSAAARLAGVPRRSMRDWLSGKSTPGMERRRALRDSARFSERRSRLTPRRESRLRGRSSDGIVIKGRYNYDALDGLYDNRNVTIGPYMDDGVIERLVDAYLSGSGPTEMRQIFAEHVNDPSGFYSRTMALPPTDDHGWTVERVTF